MWRRIQKKRDAFLALNSTLPAYVDCRYRLRAHHGRLSISVTDENLEYECSKAHAVISSQTGTYDCARLPTVSVSQKSIFY